jgi:hypothetical protein
MASNCVLLFLHSRKSRVSCKLCMSGEFPIFYYHHLCQVVMNHLPCIHCFTASISKESRGKAAATLRSTAFAHGIILFSNYEIHTKYKIFTRVKRSNPFFGRKLAWNSSQFSGNLVIRKINQTCLCTRFIAHHGRQGMFYLFYFIVYVLQINIIVDVVSCVVWY